MCTPVLASRLSISADNWVSSAIFFWNSPLTVYSSSLTECSSSFVLWSSSLAAVSSWLVACNSSLLVSISSIIAWRFSRVCRSSASRVRICSRDACPRSISRGGSWAGAGVPTSSTWTTACVTPPRRLRTGRTVTSTTRSPSGG